MLHTRIAAFAALALSMALPTSAFADASEIDHLTQENAEMKQMLMDLREQMEDIKAMAMDGGADVVKSKNESLTISTTGGGVKVKSSNGNTFKMGAFMMFDHENYDDLWGEMDKSGEENKIRRSRIDMSGTSGKHWGYKFVTDINHEKSEATVDTGFLKYTNKPFTVRIGKFKRPGVMESRTSSKWLFVLERSLLSDMGSAFLAKPKFGGIDLTYATKGDMPMSWTIGVFDNEIEEVDGGDVYEVGGRFSVMPKFEDGSFMHIGASYHQADYKGNDYRQRTRMGLNAVGFHPFDSGNQKTGDVDQIGIELAYVNGPFSIMGEHLDVNSDGTDNNGCGNFSTSPGGPNNFSTNTCDLETDGFYAQVAYTLTGETRGYKSGGGVFGAVKPKGKGGAWEVVIRYEDASFDMPARNYGASLERTVVGVNWYATKNVKLAANYMNSDVSCEATDITFPFHNSDNTAGTTGTCRNNDGNALSLRGQYVF